MADERVFSIKINGVEESYKNAKRLVDTLNLITDVTAKVTVETDKNTTSTQNNTKASKEKAKALSDEEKAQKKLTDTQEKANKEISQNEIEQAKANLQLKERAKQLQNLAKLELAAKNSPAEFKAELALLNQEWDKVEVGTQTFDDLTNKIEALNQKLKDSEFAKGTFGRNVGNYPKELDLVNESFEKLGDGIQQTSEHAKGMLSTFQAGVGIALLFGDSNSELGKIASNTGKVMAIVGSIQSANNILIKNGTIIQKARILVDTLVTKGIITQTTAQTALNIATKAFPLLAMIAVIGAVIGLLSSYSKKTKEATNETDNLKSSTEDFKKESEQTASTLASSLVIYKRLQRQWNDLANDLDKKKRFIIDNKNEFNSLGVEVNNVNDAESVLVTNTDAVINSLKLRAQAAAAQQIATEKYVEALKKQDEADKRAKSPTGSEIAHGKSVYNYEDRDEFKNVPIFQGTDLSIEAAKPIKEEGDKLLKEADTFFDKYIDLTNKSTQELTSVGIKAATKLSSDVKNTTKNTGDELAKINEDLANERIKAIEDAEQREISTIQNNLQKRLSSIKGNSNEEKELRKLLTENSEKDIANIRKKYQEQREKEEKENSKKLIDEQKTLLDIQTTHIRNFYSDIQDLQKEVRGKNGIIDTEVTKANLDEANTQLFQYISLLNNSKKEIEDYYNNLLSLYNEDSIEYKSALNDKEQALRSLEKQIKDANSEIVDNTQESTDLQKEYWKNLYDTLQEYTDKIMSGVTAIFDAANTLLQSQLDDANEKYDTISQKYDEVVEKREESDSRLQELEEEAKNARGGRALVLQEQINSEMIANQQLANQEKQLAKEKEKQEKEIAKKEKQMKKVELTQSIVQGIANTALGVTKALEWGFPLGPVFAGIVGAMGAIQVGVMTSQLAKLEDGGLLKGKRHSQGGMRVEGTNIEVEGGEYVINRDSTNKNLGLIKYINSQRRTLGPNDLSSFFSKSSQGFESPFKRMFEAGGQLPASINTSGIDYSLMASAMKDSLKEVKIEPKVSITDINDAQNDIVKINDIAGL